MHYKHRACTPQLIRIGGTKKIFRSLRSRIHYFVPPHYGIRGAAPASVRSLIWYLYGAFDLLEIRKT